MSIRNLLKSIIIFFLIFSNFAHARSVLSLRNYYNALISKHEGISTGSIVAAHTMIWLAMPVYMYFYKNLNDEGFFNLVKGQTLFSIGLWSAGWKLGENGHDKLKAISEEQIRRFLLLEDPTISGFDKSRLKKEIENQFNSKMEVFLRMNSEKARSFYIELTNDEGNLVTKRH